MLHGRQDLQICQYVTIFYGMSRVSVRDIFLKAGVFLKKLNAINELKTFIQEEITAIPNNMVQAAIAKSTGQSAVVHTK